MRITLDRRELGSIPLVEREISVSGAVLTVEFVLIDDLHLDIAFSKTFPDQAGAERSAGDFIQGDGEKENSAWEALRTFEEQQALSRISLVEGAVNHTLALPDGGRGFSCNGDLDYMKRLVEQWKGNAKS